MGAQYGRRPTSPHAPARTASHTAPASKRARATRELTGITEREREVLTRLLSEPDARDRVQLVIIAHEEGPVSATDRRRAPERARASPP
ncbi:hypothetical protein ACFQ51_14055 [Streptomyces kaempferi]